MSHLTNVSAPRVRDRSFGSLVGILVSTAGVCAIAQPFPPAGLDLFPTDASFKVTLFNGTQVTIANLHDPATVVGRSNPFAEALEPIGGVPIFNGGALPYPNTAPLAPDPRRFPIGFPEGDPNRREVHTEILSLNLVGGGGAVLAGQPAFNALNGLGLPQIYHNSFGEVASRDMTGNVANDFPADSFFDIFAVVQVGGASFANLHPLVVRRPDPLTGFPPTFGLPTETYIHDPNFPAVLLYSTASGLPVAFLSSAGHGAPMLPPGLPDATIRYQPGTSFSVDNGSIGLAPAQSPTNHVRDDVGLPEQHVTVYRNPAAYDNTRTPVLVGVVGALPNNFQATDRITSMSSGRDGTLSMQGTQEEPLNGVLHFSVDRTSQGAAGTDVELDATAFVPKQAAAVYASGVGPFGRYHDKITPPVPMNDNFLVTDPTLLGLRPSLLDNAQDNLTGLELGTFAAGDLYFGTFDGPSFAGPNARSTIFVYNTATPPFEDGSLGVYAMPATVGLRAGDMIDALALSDVFSIGGLDPLFDEVLFSLAPGSPTLLGADGLPGTGDELSAADILYSNFNGTNAIFAPFSKLGLLFSDNVDGIDIRPVADLTQVPDGDFNNDGLLDCPDINILTAAIAAGSNNPALDMNGDGAVTIADVTAPGVGWLAVAGAGNPGTPSGNPYLVADANLDGAVDGQDFIVWNANKFMVNSAWCSGNFNGDGVIDGSDFIAWNFNKFMSSDGAAAIPEPTMALLGLLGSGGLLLRRPVKVPCPHGAPRC